MDTNFEKLIRKEASCYHKTNPEEKSEDFLMNNACREVGLYDWGDTDFVIPLRMLLNSCREEGGFNSFGWFYIHSLLTKYLCGRLLIQKQYKQYPQISEEQIKKPLFIISLPRTGTTLLQRLLAQDRSNRSLLYWEGLFPAPFSEVSAQKVDSRVQAAEEFLRIRNAVVPNINIMHSVYVRQPEECFLLLDKSFMSPMLHVLFDLPSYYKWLKGQDMLPIYHYYKKQLQLLQFMNPHSAQQRWVLKSPFHMFEINSLLKVFPDACIVQIHRSPIQSLSSQCSMLTAIRNNLQENKIMDQLGSEVALFWKDMLGKTIQYRQEYGTKRFLDINYKDLTKDPVRMMHNIYKQLLGAVPKDTVTERMNKWLSENPKNKHGVHKYSPDNYGLTEEVVGRYFSEYYQYFGLQDCSLS
ncbi:hypothetical protein KKHLCK_00470 [Candidatus Electrothrix laxa]